VLDQISSYLLKDETAMVDATFIVNGNNNAGRGQSQGQLFVRLKDWSERRSAAHERGGAVRPHQEALRFIQPAIIFPDQSAADPRPGQCRRASTSSCRIAAASDTTRCARARPAARPGNHPTAGPGALQRRGRQSGFKIDIDREKAGSYGVRRGRHRPGLLDRLGFALRQQLPRHRQPHQARLRAGRCALSHESG
jgi:multidrug efflux pump subunit AcrB